MVIYMIIVKYIPGSTLLQNLIDCSVCHWVPSPKFCENFDLQLFSSVQKVRNNDKKLKPPSIELLKVCDLLLPLPRRLCFCHCLFVCLFVSNFAQKLQTDLHEIFREGWQWASKQMIKFWWWPGSPSGCRNCFRDSSLFGRYGKLY